MSVVGRLIIKKAVSSLFKETVNYIEDEKEIKKRNMALADYASKVANADERDALITFAAIEGTEDSIERFRKEIESGEMDQTILENYEMSNDIYRRYYPFMSRMSRTPERQKKLDEMDLNKRLWSSMKKIREEPEFREKMINHFYNISKEL
jgi:hypothetical protein